MDTRQVRGIASGTNDDNLDWSMAVEVGEVRKEHRFKRI